MNRTDDYQSDSNRFSTLCLYNLPQNITAIHLFRFFRNLGYCGALNEYSIKFIKDNLSKKYALVTFESAGVAREILQLYERRLFSVPGCPDVEIKPLFRNWPGPSQGEEPTGTLFPLVNKSRSSVGNSHSKSWDNVANLSLNSLQLDNFPSNGEPRVPVFDHRKCSTSCSVVVNNVTYGMETALKSVFSKYGRLQQPEDITIQRAGTQCYAIVNFCHPLSVKAILENRNSIFVGLRKLEISQLNTGPETSANDQLSHNLRDPFMFDPYEFHQWPENALSSASDNSSEASDGKKFDCYPKLLITNVPYSVLKSDIFSVFKVFGRIAEPPGIIIQRDKRIALVPFTDSLYIKNAIEVTQGSVVMRGGVTVNIFAYDAENSISGDSSSSSGRTRRRNRAKGKRHDRREVRPTQALNSHYLQIRNVNGLKSSPSDLMKKYLRNERRSGGGEIEDFTYDALCDRILVKFQKQEILERVLNNKTGHLLEGVSFYVNKLPPISSKHVYLNQVPERISKSDLEQYFGRIVNSKIVDIKFRCDNSGAMIEFKDDLSVDIERLEKQIISTPLKHLSTDETRIDLLPVYEPDSVLIRGQLSSIDAVSLTLEDFLLSKVSQSIDCTIRYVIERPKDQLYWVIFEDYRCLRFLTDRLKVGESEVSITKFYDHLGFISSNDHANFIRAYGSSSFCVELTSLQMKYFQKKKNLDGCKTWPCFNHWMFVLTLNEEKPELQIVAKTEQVSRKIADAIKSQLKPIFISLDDAMLKLISGKTTIFDEEMERFFEDDYAYEIIDSSTLTVVTSETQKMCQVIDQFFDTKTNITEEMTRNILEYKYLKKRQQLILHLSEDCRMNWSDDDQCLYASGNLSNLKNLRQNLDEVLKGNEVLQLNFTKNGIPAYFRSAVGRRDIQMVADSTEAVILDAESNQIDFNAVLSARSSLKGCRLSGAYRSLKIFVFCDDMTEQTVDCIINASNNELQHYGGLAVALLNKAGDTLQSECTAHVRKHGKVKTGDVFASNAGKLNCSKVIHAVGPRYGGGRQNEETLLRQAVLNSMRKVNELGMRSVAVPAISTSVFGYPAQLAVPIIVDACLSFAHGSLAEIRFVDLNMQTIDLLISQLKSLPDFKPLSESRPKSTVVASTPTDSISRLVPEVMIVKSDDRITQHLSFNDCKINIIKDSIVNVAQDFDVIVNTTGNDIFSGGACSKAITVAAGQALIDDVQANYPSGIGNDELAVTVAGNLPCKKIYHVYCTAWSSQTSPDQLRDKIFACLNEAEASDFKSIAFPAIGTGGLKFPADEVARLMIDFVQNWLEDEDRQRPVTIEKIAIVIFPGDQKCADAFDNEYSSRLNVDFKTVNIGQLVVEIVRGDLTQEAADVVVCPTNEELDLDHGQVCRALTAAAGPNALENLVASLQRNEKDDIHILNVDQRTKLKAARILFVNVTHKESNDDWLSVFDDILTSVNNLLLKNISMPLIGAGNLGMKADEIISLMFQAFQKFSMDINAESSLKKIRIMIPQSTNFRSVCEYLDDGKLTTLADAKIRFSIFKGIMKKALPNSKAFETSNISSEKPLCLALYGTKVQIEKAESLLIELSEENWPRKVIHSSLVEQLGNLEIDHLQNEARKLNIELSVHRSDREIKLRGSDVEKFADLTHDVLRQFVEHINCPTDAKWYKKSTKNPDWEPVEVGLMALELAYKSKKQNSISLNIFENEDDVIVDMKDMLVKDITGSNILWKLKRKRHHDIIPIEWDWNEEATDLNSQHRLVQLDTNSKEYRRVRDAALKSSPSTNIVKIERVENPTRYKQYVLAKAVVEKVVSAGLPSERLLFHGTAPDRVTSICAGCFDRSMSGVNAVMYGQGSYFHNNFSYSLQYGQGKTVFYCNVLTGNYCLGNQTMRTAPEFDPAKKIRYDSTVDSPTNPNIFVVYSDNHSYPSYLITCA